MRIGISPFASTRSTAVEVAARAMEGGLDTLWLGDGYLASPDFPPWSGGMEPFCELAWLAGQFPAARLGITAAVLPIRDADWLVKQAATLDQLTEGRFVLVVTPGFWEADATARGVDFAGRGAAFDESLAAIRGHFAGTGVGGGPALSPPPHTAGGPPLWLAGADATMGKALRLGLPFQASRLMPDELAPLARRWFDAGGTMLAHRARIQVGGAVPRGHGVDWNTLVGPPTHLAEQLHRFVELGVTDLSLVPGQDDRTALDTVAALVTEVVPALPQ